MGKARRPCPRGLYDGCPISRELCTAEHEQTGQWNCLKLLEDLEFFLFGSSETGESQEEIYQKSYDDSGEVRTLEDLMCVLEGEGNCE